LARDAVLGDLRESCGTNGQYVREILKAAPFVVASQMTRHLNVPVLMLQAALIFHCLGGGAVALALPVLMLREAYRPPARPDPQAALRAALFLAFGGLLLEVLTPVRLKNPMSVLILAAPLSFALCAFRTGVIVGVDRLGQSLPQTLSLAGLCTLRQGFLMRLRRRRRLEAIALALSALCWPGLIGDPLGVGLAAVYLAVALYLLTGNLAENAPSGTSFVSLRHRYAEEVNDGQQLSRFLYWLWVAPGLVMVSAAIVPGGQPARVVFHAGLAILLCFGAGAINREGCGRVQEEIVALSRLREASA
jgi:hypothetical protein